VGAATDDELHQILADDSRLRSPERAVISEMLGRAVKDHRRPSRGHDQEDRPGLLAAAARDDQGHGQRGDGRRQCDSDDSRPCAERAPAHPGARELVIDSSRGGGVQRWDVGRQGCADGGEVG
jgi:hypothetical protein